MTDRRLTMLIHGDSGHGKSWLADTAPGPRLILDAEGRADYTPSNKIMWDPRTAPPEVGPDDSVVVDVQSFDTAQMAYTWLASGKHPFNSVIVDSITELQQRVLDAVTGSPSIQPQTQHWGTLLREMESFVRKLRDLRKHPVKPLWAVVLVAGSQEKNNKQRPFLQGQLGIKIAYHMDVVGYLVRQQGDDGQEQRVLHIKPFGFIEAKDNTHILSQQYGGTIINPDVTDMLNVLNPVEVA